MASHLSTGLFTRPVFSYQSVPYAVLPLSMKYCNQKILLSQNFVRMTCVIPFLSVRLYLKKDAYSCIIVIFKNEVATFVRRSQNQKIIGLMEFHPL